MYGAEPRARAGTALDDDRAALLRNTLPVELMQSGDEEDEPLALDERKGEALELNETENVALVEGLADEDAARVSDAVALGETLNMAVGLAEMLRLRASVLEVETVAEPACEALRLAARVAVAAALRDGDGKSEAERVRLFDDDGVAREGDGEKEGVVDS